MKASKKDSPESDLRHLEGLAQIGRAVMEKHYIDDLLALIVSVTAKVTGSSICSILMLDKEKKELVLRASQSESGRYTQKSNTPLGQGIAGRVALTGEPVCVLDVRKDPRYLNKEIAEQDGLVSLLSVPMSAEGEVAGVINCYTPREYEFSKHDAQMLSAVAGQAAILLRSTELRVMKELVERELEERKLVERAKEILAEKKGVSSRRAYSLMRKHSMNNRISMAKIAESIVLSSDL